MRGGGSWKRDYGSSYTGTKGKTPDTAKEPPTDYRASSRPYQVAFRRSMSGGLVAENRRDTRGLRYSGVRIKIRPDWSYIRDVDAKAL